VVGGGRCGLRYGNYQAVQVLLPEALGAWFAEPGSLHHSILVRSTGCPIAALETPAIEHVGFDTQVHATKLKAFRVHFQLPVLSNKDYLRVPAQLDEAAPGIRHA